MSATIGAGATAQLGAMRINDEIDALEVIGHPFDRLPGVDPRGGRGGRGDPAVLRRDVCAFFAARIGTAAIYGQCAGVYDHYFNTFLNPTDVIWSFFRSVAMAVADHAGAHLLRVHRQRWAGGSR